MDKLRGILAKAGQDGHSFDMSFKYIKAGCCLDATLTFIITASVKSRIQKTAAYFTVFIYVTYKYIHAHIYSLCIKLSRRKCYWHLRT